VRLELPPFRNNPAVWTKLSFRLDAGRWIAHVLIIGALAGLAWGQFLGSASSGFSFALTISVALLIGFYFNTKQRLEQEAGFAWEEQHVVLDNDCFRTTYESGYTVEVPWKHFRSARRFSEGLVLSMTGGGHGFVPKEVLTPEVEAFLRERIGS
jgi:hypothetical protein